MPEEYQPANSPPPAAAAPQLQPSTSFRVYLIGQYTLHEAEPPVLGTSRRYRDFVQVIQKRCQLRLGLYRCALCLTLETPVCARIEVLRKPAGEDSMRCCYGQDRKTAQKSAARHEVTIGAKAIQSLILLCATEVCGVRHGRSCTDPDG